MGNSETNYTRIQGYEEEKGQTPIYRGLHLAEGEELLTGFDDGISDLKKLYLRSFDKFESIQNYVYFKISQYE